MSTPGLNEAIEAAAVEMWQFAGEDWAGTAWADIHPARQGWYRGLARAAARILVVTERCKCGHFRSAHGYRSLRDGLVDACGWCFGCSAFEAAREVTQ